MSRLPRPSRLLRFAALAAVGFCGYLAFAPGSIEPAAWTPPRAPRLEGPYAVNDGLAAAVRVGQGMGTGPEGMALDGRGRLCTGVSDGRILCGDGAGGPWTVLADTGGRPLGMELAPSGELIVADARMGLLAVTADGKVQVLSTEAGGVPYGFTDDLAVASDGTIYFTDASFRFSMDQYVLDLLEHRPNGRLLAYHPDTGTAEVLLDGLYFANGVALANDGSFLVVCETGLYRLTRLWLTGARRGQADVFIDNLPGFPDNVTTSPDGQTFWLAIVSPRDPLVDAMLPHPAIRRLVAKLPDALRPGTKRHAFVLGLSLDGKVVANLQDASSGSYSPITSALEVDGQLWLGSLERDSVARVPLAP